MIKKNLNKSKKNAGQFQIVFSLFKLAAGQKGIIIGSIIVLMLAVLCDAAAKFVIRYVVDEALDKNLIFARLFFLTGVYVVFVLCQACFSFLEGRGKSLASENIARNIREYLFDHIQKLSFKYHDKTSSGELVQRSTSDVDAVRRFFAEQLFGFLRILLLFFINFTALALIDLRLAFTASAIVPVIGFLSVFFFNRIHDSYEQHQEQEGHLTAFVQENLAGSRVVRAFARQERENRCFDVYNQELRKKGFLVLFWNNLYWPVSFSLCGIQFTVAFLFGGWLVLQGELSVGSMIASTFLINALIWPMQEMGRIITEISRGTVSYRRIEEVFQEELEVARDGQTRNNGHLQGEIQFRDVGFWYNDGTPVLNDVSFDCRAGETIALLGKTGSGKTTVVNLLPRFYDYSAGKILLDGIPLQEYDRHFLRQHIGIVEQSPFLFSVSIRENIALGSLRDVSQAEIEEAARHAAIHEHIVRYPDGYDTLVGEKGVSLSGGQKQRIAIARALLKDPRLLILDDSTSAVDAETEAQIQAALDRLMQGRTTFIIAHRIQTLMKADKILVMDRGRIVQMGTHQELVGVRGFYREVFEMQTRLEEEMRTELEVG